MAAALGALLVAGASHATEAAALPAGEHAGAGDRLELALMWLTLNLARLIEGAAALIIAVASARALGAYARSLVQRGEGQPKEEIRLSLGRSLALALEFELGADILKTAVAPTWNAIGLLAAIAVLRTALNFFLERELERADHRSNPRSEGPRGPHGGPGPEGSPTPPTPPTPPTSSDRITGA